MKKAVFAAVALVVGAVATNANADSFKCGNGRTGLPNARWFTQISHTREAGKPRKPGFFLLHNAKKDGAIVRTDDRRRIKMAGKDEQGTRYTVKLNAKEKKALRELADGRLNLKGAASVTLWVNFEPNEDLDDGDTRPGSLSVDDEDGEEVYTTKVGCTYDDATN